MAASKSPHIRLLHIRDEIDGVTAALAGVIVEMLDGQPDAPP
jgi:hypothetical protein